MTDPPGVYTTPPTQEGGTDWSLPTFVADTGPVGNATVTLTYGGVVVATTTTDAEGRYAFTGLTAGSYTVTITDLPTPDRAAAGTWQYPIASCAGCMASATSTVTAWTAPLPLVVYVAGTTSGQDVVSSNDHSSSSATAS